MGGSQRLHGMAHGAVGTNHGSWATHTRRNTEGRDERTSSELIRCLRLALPSAGPAVGGRLDRHPADSRRAVAPAERGPARALGASKRHKPREWPRSGVQPQKICFCKRFFWDHLSGRLLFFGVSPESGCVIPSFMFLELRNNGNSTIFFHHTALGLHGRAVLMISGPRKDVLD